MAGYRHDYRLGSASSDHVIIGLQYQIVDLTERLKDMNVSRPSHLQVCCTILHTEVHNVTEFLRLQSVSPFIVPMECQDLLEESHKFQCVPNQGHT